MEENDGAVVLMYDRTNSRRNEAKKKSSVFVTGSFLVFGLDMQCANNVRVTAGDSSIK
jgi:hypothetical protein